jgi:hypothetical protein
METYKIVRNYFNQEYESEVIAEGLDLTEAQEWCRDPETSSRTCTSEEGCERTAERGPWFDGYEEE